MLHDLLPLTVAAPLTLAALLLPLGTVAPRWVVDALSTLCAAASCVICATIASATLSGPMLYWFGGWYPSHGVALGIAFAPDATGAGLAAVVGALVTLAFVFAWRYFDSAGTLFHALMLVFLAAMTGFALTGDIFNLFVFFELMSVSAFALTAFKVEEPQAIRGAINFAVTNSIGAFMVLFGIALLYGRTGALNIAQIAQSVAHQHPDGLLIASFSLMLCGFFVKSAVVPFHFWLDDAHAVAPTPLCVLFSGIMVQLGLYAIARVYWSIFATPLQHGAEHLRLILVIAGILSALIGAIMAYSQNHLKRLLAFSTISHSGLFLCGIGMLSGAGIAAVSVFVVAHGFLKGALFMGSGILLQRFRTLDETQLKGKGTGLWALAILFIGGGLMLAGLPPFGIAAAKTLLEDSVKPDGYGWLIPVFLIASAIDGAAVLRVAARVFLGVDGEADTTQGKTPRTEQRETQSSSRGATAVMLASAYAALAFSALVGFAPLWRDGLARAAQLFVHANALPRLEFEASSTLSDAATALLAVAIAVAGILAGKFGPKHLTRTQHVLMTPLVALRNAHDGIYTNYVFWQVVGLAAYGAALVPLAR